MISPTPSPQGGSCSNVVNTELRVLQNGKEKQCTALLNKFFPNPPADLVGLASECQKTFELTDGRFITGAEACPTYCNFNECCPINKQIELDIDGKKKKCGGLLKELRASAEGKIELGQLCAREVPIWGTTTNQIVLVSDVCKGYCDLDCPVEP